MANADRIIELLHEAKARPAGAERARFLDETCRNDPTLKEQVLSLLEADAGDSGSFLKNALLRPSRTLVTEKPGDRIGRYKLLEQIGEGGCGVVYMAEQEEPVRRRVALKVIKLGMDTKSVIARFEAERQALALIDHPNIAKVLDAGATETGRPYFVMELVRGIKITDYCDQNNLSTEQRLKLFTQVCQAIQHAHQKGIIHRDIKPSNILVTVNDGASVPKVIDFGIVKATGQRLTDKTLFTQFHAFIGTPAYISPEQAEMSSVDIDTRSDIYSLGVLLYELLTGRTPFDGESLLRSGLDEMRRTIRDQQPSRPSVRLDTLGVAEATELSAKRQASIPKLAGDVRGDLDWVVMKCLEKDRSRRYETANGLAVDIQRHLTNEPIVARPPSNLYRFQKLVRRNKLAVAATSAVTIALLLGLGISTLMFFKEKQAHQRAVAAEREQEGLRKQAEQTRQQAEARAYASDMVFAAQSADSGASLGSVEKVLSYWLVNAPGLRGWEWYYLDGLCHRDRLTIRGDSKGFFAVAWSPDGKRLASAGGDHTVRLWNALTGHEIMKLQGHKDEVVAVVWSPDGKHLASASKDKTVKVWDAETAGEILTLRGHSDAPRCVAWSLDGKKLASGGMDQTTRLWDAVTGRVIHTLPGRAVIQAVSWNADGTRLASADDVDASSSVTVWDAVNGKELLTVREGGVRSVAWSPDDKWLAMGGSASCRRIMDAASGSNTLTVCHAAPAVSVAWSFDGTRVATGSWGDGSVKVWEAMTGQELHSFRGHLGAARSVSWRPDGTQVASASLDGTIRVWDVNHRDRFRTALRQSSQGISLAWHPDARQLATGGSDGSVRIWDSTRAVESVVLPGHTSCVWRVVWNPTGTMLASGSHDGVIKLWDPKSGTEVWSVQAHPKEVRALAWSPDGKRLASASDDTTVRVWDLETGRELHTLRGHVSAVYSVAWNPDGTRLVSGSWDTKVNIWNPVTGALVCSLAGHDAPVESVGWSPDGMRIASSDIAGIFLVHDTTPGHTAERKHKLAESEGRSGKPQGRKEPSP